MHARSDVGFSEVKQRIAPSLLHLLVAAFGTKAKSGRVRFCATVRGTADISDQAVSEIKVTVYSEAAL